MEYMLVVKKKKIFFQKENREKPKEENQNHLQSHQEKNYKTTSLLLGRFLVGSG